MIIAINQVMPFIVVSLDEGNILLLSQGNKGIDGGSSPRRAGPELSRHTVVDDPYEAAGRSFKMMPFTTENTAVFAPMPKASAARAKTTSEPLFASERHA
jgi:hypothetical protein